MAEHGHVRRARHFNPRSPDGERLEFLPCFDSRVLISIHAPRMGSDTRRSARRPKGCHFNPRSPDGERPGPCHPAACSSRYFNPRSPDGERRRQPRRQPRPLGISIHAPRMGSDCSRCPRPPSAGYFNPRSPDGERLHVRILACLLPDFNPRSPDGERPHRYDRASHSNYYFNPRSPDGERPPTRLPYECPARHFNPRSPDGERLGDFARYASHANISIHAPRMGSDAI